MEQKIIEKLFREKDLKIKKGRNTFLKIFLAVFCGGYFLFLTSNMWYPTDYSKMQTTKFQQAITKSKRTVRLMGWTYSEKQNKMEVEIQIENLAFDGKDTYEWSVIDRKKGTLKVETVIETKGFVVLHISDLPAKWTNLSLRMEIPDEENVDMIKMYTNKKVVERVDNIQILTLNQYMIKGLEKNITLYKADIKNKEKSIKANKEKEKNIEKEIQTYIEEQKYETEKQKEISNAAISNLEGNIQLLIDDNAQLEKEIQEIYERIEKAEERKEEYNE